MELSLRAADLCYSYTGDSLAVSNVSLSLKELGVTFMLGANGAGKTTLIQCLCGIMPPTSGCVLMNEQELGKINPADRARSIGFVPQIHQPVFTYSVYQVVLMGRTPYLSVFRHPQKDDHRKVSAILQSLDLWALRHKPYTKISGGEQRLVLIARGLAQGARYLLMDEPDAHLDPHHQHDIFTQTVSLAKEGFTFAISSHNPNNAILYADYVSLFAAGRLIAQGSPQETVTPENLQRTYDMQFETITDSSGLRAIVPAINNDTQS